MFICVYVKYNTLKCVQKYDLILNNHFVELGSFTNIHKYRIKPLNFR